MPGNPFKKPYGGKAPSAPTSRPSKPSVNANLPKNLPAGGKSTANRSAPGANPTVRVTDKARRPVSRPSPGTPTSGKGIC